MKTRHLPSTPVTWVGCLSCLSDTSVKEPATMGKSETHTRISQHIQTLSSVDEWKVGRGRSSLYSQAGIPCNGMRRNRLKLEIPIPDSIYDQFDDEQVVWADRLCHKSEDTVAWTNHLKLKLNAWANMFNTHVHVVCNQRLGCHGEERGRQRLSSSITLEILPCALKLAAVYSIHLDFCLLLPRLELRHKSESLWTSSPSATFWGTLPYGFDICKCRWSWNSKSLHQGIPQT